MARTEYHEESTHCVSCGAVVPPERAIRGGTTCTDVCAKKRRRLRQARVELKECKYCHKPCTPEERKAYKRFRKLEMEAPHLLYPEEFAKWHEEVDGNFKGFAEWWQTKVASEDTDLRRKTETEAEAENVELAEHA